jgi:hypothetical protein
VAATIYQISPDIRAPYIIQSAASVERQIAKGATLAVTYLNSRGEHMFYTRNTNAPFVPEGAAPNPGAGNVCQYDSEGIFRQGQMIVNGRVALGRGVSLFGFYTLSYAHANVSGGGGGQGIFNGLTSSASFLSDSYDPMADYGRSSFDVRHRGLIAGSIEVSPDFARVRSSSLIPAPRITSRPGRTTTAIRFLKTGRYWFRRQDARA